MVEKPIKTSLEECEDYYRQFGNDKLVEKYYDVYNHLSAFPKDVDAILKAEAVENVCKERNLNPLKWRNKTIWF
jgi:hypothetical protein